MQYFVAEIQVDTTQSFLSGPTQKFIVSSHKDDILSYRVSQKSLANFSHNPVHRQTETDEQTNKQTNGHTLTIA